MTVEFSNGKHGNLIITKIDSATKQPLPGAQFKITTSDGSFVGNYGGTVTSNGIYTTDSNGQIKLVDLKPDTYVVTEVKAPDGYVLDSTSQTVKVDRNDTQTLTFTNTPIGGGQIIKVDADSGERIKGVQFEIAKMNGEHIGTYTTDRNGIITLPQLADGWYTATEIKAAKGYLLDSTPHNFEVKAGKTTSLTVENTQASSMLIHKIDSVTGKGIYGVTFLVSDSKGNPIGQYTSDQNGYVYIDKTLTDGKYLVREIQAADGYVLDTTVKTFYVEYGGTSTITWKNTPITGQIQIVKKSADYNPTNGLPAGTLLEGAVFEITDKAGNVIDTIRSNSRGLAVSKQLPLSRYFVREIKAPDHYGINDKELTAYLEYEGQILRFEVEDKSLSTGVAITKTGPKEIVAGQPVRYAFSGIANTSNVSLSSFYWRDTLPAQVRLDTVVTGTYNRPGTYKLTAALEHPFQIQWTDKSLLSILICTGAYIMGLCLYDAEGRRTRDGEEHGSAMWGSPKQVNAQFCQKQNKILTRHVRLGLDTHKHRRSLNVLVIGGSGAAKTRGYVKPNILEANTNYVITDPKMEVLTDTGGYLKQQGYDVRVLNLVNLDQSDGYTPRIGNAWMLPA